LTSPQNATDNRRKLKHQSENCAFIQKYCQSANAKHAASFVAFGGSLQALLTAHLFLC